MYDERTRQLDHQWATYAYAREEGIEYGMAQGIERGRAEGRAEDMRLGIQQAIINLLFPKNQAISKVFREIGLADELVQE